MLRLFKDHLGLFNTVKTKDLLWTIKDPLTLLQNQNISVAHKKDQLRPSQGLLYQQRPSYIMKKQAGNIKNIGLDHWKMVRHGYSSFDH